MKDNQIIGNPKLEDAKINLSGHDNILWFESNNIDLANSTINFKGNNSVVIIRNSKNIVKINATIYSDSVIYIGENVAMNNKLELIASEAKNIFIGDDGLFSSQCLIRTSDAHRIYSIADMQRINEGRSVYIGDYVWVAARAVLLKGTKIHSGSIIGSDAVVAGKEVLSNTIWAGNPAKEIKTGVVFDKTGTHGLRSEEIAEVRVPASTNIQQFIYENDDSYMSFDTIDKRIIEQKTSEKKLQYILKLMSTKRKNRFAKIRN